MSIIESARSLYCAPRHNSTDVTMRGAMDSISFDIFLSYTSLDKAVVERIAFLQPDGFTHWLDAWNHLAGGNWQDGIEQGLRHANGCVVFFGAAGSGDWTIQEMKVANRSLTPPEWQRFIDDPADLNRPYQITCDNLPDPSDAAKGMPVTGDAMAPAGATPVARGQGA